MIRSCGVTVLGGAARSRREDRSDMVVGIAERARRPLIIGATSARGGSFGPRARRVIRVEGRALRVSSPRMTPGRKYSGRGALAGRQIATTLQLAKEALSRSRSA